MPEFINPSNVLDQLPLKSAMIAADFGCGSGGWTIPLAKRLIHGKVFAVDLKEEALSALRSKAKLEGVFNIKEVLGDLELGVTDLRNEAFDLVLITDLLFQIEQREDVFKEAARVLKPGGMLLVIGWRKGAPLSPRQGCLAESEMEEIALSQGFKKEKEIKAGDYHYGVLFSK